MKVKVLGAGCSKCRSTIGLIERTARDAGIAVEIVKVESPDEIQAYGVHATPAVVIADRVVHSGGIPSHESVRTWFEPPGVGFLNHPTPSTSVEFQILCWCLSKKLMPAQVLKY